MKFTALPSTTVMLQRNSSGVHNTDDDPATTAPIDSKASETIMDPSLSRKRGVHFNESDNVEYESLQCKEETRCLWYNARDYVAFRQERRDEATALRATERLSNDPNSWAKAHLHVYQVFCAAHRPEDIEFLMPKTPEFNMTTHTVGMEKTAVPSIAKDTAARRAQIYSLVDYWQKFSINSANFRTNMIRESSSDLSRPSRLYASNIALVSAAVEL